MKDGGRTEDRNQRDVRAETAIGSRQEYEFGNEQEGKSGINSETRLRCYP